MGPLPDRRQRRNRPAAVGRPGYAGKLKTAGVAVKLIDVAGVTHEFSGMGEIIDKPETGLHQSPGCRVDDGDRPRHVPRDGRPLQQLEDPIAPRLSDGTADDAGNAGTGPAFP
jgi:hypothetical protein